MSAWWNRRSSMRNRPFHRLLRAKGMTVSKLAKTAEVGRTHLTLVLNGDRRGNRETWDKVATVLTHEEYMCAKTYADGVIAAKEREAEVVKNSAHDAAGTG